MVRELIKCDTREKRYVIGLLAILLFGLVCYGYFVNRTIVRVVERRTFERSIDSLSTEVADLALEYIDLKNSVTTDRAHELGFVSETEISYVSRGQFARSN